MASSTLQGALKNGFGEAVMACIMPKPCKFPFLDSCKMFLWTYKEVGLTLHPVIGLVLQTGDTEASQALGFDSLDPFFRVSKQVPRFTAIEEDGGDKRLVEK